MLVPRVKDYLEVGVVLVLCESMLLGHELKFIIHLSMFLILFVQLGNLLLMSEYVRFVHKWVCCTLIFYSVVETDTVIAISTSWAIVLTQEL